MIATTEPTTTLPAVPTSRIAGDKMLRWLGLASALVVSAALNLWNLAQNGYDNLYYSVAVQSMMQSFHNFFFASYDAGGYISVDKPPVALWVQTISAKLLGFTPIALLLPQALAGVAAVAVIFFLVRRWFGPLAATVAALALALTPIAVAVDRGNNTDTLLMFTLVLAAAAMLRATEKGRFALLALALALVGVAFNIKMLEAFIVLPTFYLLYLVFAPIKLYKRLLHLSLGSIVLLGVALSWPLAVDLTPASQRPWVGGSQTNSVLELALGYNGLGRVTGQGEMRGGRGGFGGTTAQSSGLSIQGLWSGIGQLFSTVGKLFQQQSNSGPFGGNGGFGRGGGPGGAFPGGGLFDAGSAGLTRLFTGALASQWSWLIPLALFGLLTGVLALRRRNLLKPRSQAIFLWGGWLLTYGIVFSSAQGIFHPYYLIVLAPAAAALVGIGVGLLWAAYRRGGWQAWLLPVALVVTALWEANVLTAYPQWDRWLAPLTFGASVVAALPLAATRLLSVQVWRRWAPGLVGVGLVALLVSPLGWAITPVLAAPSNASLPEAGPYTLNQRDPTSWTQISNTASSGLVAYLEDNSQGYLYLVAVANSQQASSIALATGRPVLATGGFMGTDPALTADKLAQMVATRQVRFVMGLGGGFNPRGGSAGSDTVNGWVSTHCQAVDASAYGGSAGGFSGQFGFGGFGGRGGTQLYDCAADS